MANERRTLPPYQERQPSFLAEATRLGSGPAPAILPGALKGAAPTAELALPLRIKPPRVVIVTGRWHADLVDVYASRVADALLALDPLMTVECVRSVGVGELPFTVRRVLDNDADAYVICKDHQRFAAVICLGVLIKGDTYHMETTAVAAGVALAQLQVERNIPVLNGVVAAFCAQDAVDRTTGDKCSADYLARTALHLGNGA